MNISDNIEPEEKIIVFRAYDTAMQANLAKTKLDAYGIPCFLTDENLTNLYPIRNAIFPGVRLYIFEKDTNEVKTILEENQFYEGFIKCPRCGSHDYEPYLSSLGRLSFMLIGILSMIFPMRPHSEYQCKNCGEKFD